MARWSSERPDLRAIARVVTARRAALGLSVGAAAEAAGIEVVAWASIEGGYELVSVATYEAVGRVLGGPEVTGRLVRLARLG